MASRLTGLRERVVCSPDDYGIELPEWLQQCLCAVSANTKRSEQDNCQKLEIGELETRVVSFIACNLETCQRLVDPFTLSGTEVDESSP